MQGDVRGEGVEPIPTMGVLSFFLFHFLTYLHAGIGICRPVQHICFIGARRVAEAGQVLHILLDVE